MSNRSLRRFYSSEKTGKVFKEIATYLKPLQKSPAKTRERISYNNFVQWYRYVW